MAPEDLREMLREQERAIEHQVHAMEDQDEKSRHMIQLSVAALAGGVALATVLLRGPDQLTPAVLGPLALAAGLNLTALVLFVDAYVGFREHTDAHVGPSPAWIAEKAGDDRWTLENHLLAQIEMTPRYFEHNLRVIGDAARRRRAGLHWLLSALLAYAGGVHLYPVGGHRVTMTKKARRRTVTDPEDLPDPAIIPISGLSRESRAYLQARRAKTEDDAETDDL